MALDKDELSKLSPLERIRKLRQLEEERKKDIAEADALLKRSEAELAEEKRLPDMEVPKLEPVDISKMFEPEEGLEAALKGVPTPKQDEEAAVKYAPKVAYEEHSASPYEAGLAREEERRPQGIYRSDHQELAEMQDGKAVLRMMDSYRR